MQSLDATRTELLDRRRRAVFVAEGSRSAQGQATRWCASSQSIRPSCSTSWKQLRKLAVRAPLRLEEAVVVCGREPLESDALVAETGHRRRAAVADGGWRPGLCSATRPGTPRSGANPTSSHQR
jgi:hypothetical protein